MKKLIAGIGLLGAMMSIATGQTSVSVMLKDFYNETGYHGSIDGYSLTDVNGTLFFTATDSAHGRELWRSNGTIGGTYLVKDIYPGMSGSSIMSGGISYTSSPNLLTNLNGMLYFFANDGVHGTELWKSDGTEAGTVMVKDIYAGLNSGALSSFLININGTLFFTAEDGTTNHDPDGGGTGLWKSDGTENGTVLLKYISYQYTNQAPWAVNVNGVLFFGGTDGTVYGSELMKSDGTPGGTVVVKDIHTGMYGSSSPSGLTEMDEEVYFNATDSAWNHDLWKSDGTAAGTVIVKTHISPQYLTNADGTLFFFGENDTLYKSDGLTVTALKKLLPEGMYRPAFIHLNGNVFFAAHDNQYGTELWKSDGTAGGTVLVKDIIAGSTYSSVGYITAYDGFVYFAVGSSGGGIWRSDGTETGTTFVSNVYYGSTNIQTDASYLTLSGNVLYFSTAFGLYRLDAPSSGIETYDMPNISVFPNPTNGKFTLTTDITQGGTVEVYTLSGLKVFEEKVLSLTFASIDIAGLAKGIYIVKVSNPKTVWTDKIVIE